MTQCAVWAPLPLGRELTAALCCAHHGWLRGPAWGSTGPATCLPLADHAPSAFLSTEIPDPSQLAINMSYGFPLPHSFLKSAIHLSWQTAKVLFSPTYSSIEFVVSSICMIHRRPSKGQNVFLWTTKTKDRKGLSSSKCLLEQEYCILHVYRGRIVWASPHLWTCFGLNIKIGVWIYLDAHYSKR